VLGIADNAQYNHGVTGAGQAANPVSQCISSPALGAALAGVVSNNTV